VTITAGEEAAQGKNQATLNDYVHQVIPLGFNHPTACTQFIAEMIALDNQPFSIVDDIGVMKVLQPRCTIPSKRYFAEIAIPGIFGQVTEAMGNFFA